MSHTITISPQVYELLAQQARQARQSPDVIAESLLRRSLTTETQAWQEAFESLVARVQARTAQFSSEEIEADITAAADEVKELRRARHRPD
jgi:predicted CopG family antitoxin